MYIIHFDAIAVVLTCINLYIFYNQKRVKNRLSTRFELILWLNLGSSIFGVISSLALNYPKLFSVNSQLAATMAFYLFHNSMPYAFAHYALTLSGKTLASFWQRLIFRLPLFFAFVIILTNPLTRFVFYIDQDLIYHRGVGVPVLYAFVFIYFLYLLILIIKRCRMLSPLIRLVYTIVLSLFLCAVVMENLISPYRVLLVCFASAVSMLLLLYTIQNSKELIDGDTGLFNKASFIKYIETRLKNGARFDILLICVQNVPLLRQVFKIQDLLQLFRALSAALSKVAGKGVPAFALENESYALILSAFSAKDRQELIHGIVDRCDKAWLIGETALDISVKLCLVHCPDDIRGVIDIFDCLEQMEGFTESRDAPFVLRPADLNLKGREKEAETEEALRAALHTGLIDMLYQPIYSVTDNSFVIVEALLSLKTGAGGFIPQSELFRVAERVGLAQRLGLMIIDTAFAFYASLVARNERIDQIQVRLSDAQCMQSDLATQILALRNAWKINASHLCFQITETAAVHSPAIMNANMKLLSENKFNFALDDYGSGYTNLSYIAQLPFSHIKLDKSIVHAGFESEKGRIILNGTIGLLKKLNRKIIAEGVESAEQAETLTALGCDYLQGFFFSKLIEAGEVKSLYER